MIDILFYLSLGFLLLFWMVYKSYPTKKDVKGTEPIGIIVSSDKTFQEAFQDAVDKVKARSEE